MDYVFGLIAVKFFPNPRSQDLFTLFVCVFFFLSFAVFDFTFGLKIHIEE